MFFYYYIHPVFNLPLSHAHKVTSVTFQLFILNLTFAFYPQFHLPFHYQNAVFTFYFLDIVC